MPIAITVDFGGILPSDLKGKEVQRICQCLWKDMSFLSEEVWLSRADLDPLSIQAGTLRYVPATQGVIRVIPYHLPHHPPSGNPDRVEK